MESKFEGMAIYGHLLDFLKRQGAALLDEEEMTQEKNNLVVELKKLALQISIPELRLDDAVVENIRIVPGIELTTTLFGLKVDLSNCSEDVRNRLYDLTVYGEMEAILRGNIVDSLKQHLENVEGYVDNVEKLHELSFEKSLETYQQMIDDCSEGAFGYEYEGKNIPDKPIYYPFEREVTITARKDYLNGLDLSDGSVVLREALIPPSDISDMLHQEFESLDMVDDIIANLSFDHLNEQAITHMLRSKVFHFPYCDVMSRGFLSKVILNNIEVGFVDERLSENHRDVVITMLTAMSKHQKLSKILNCYKEAVEKNDNLSLQKCWFYLHRFISFLSSEMLKDKFYGEDLPNKLEGIRRSFKDKHKKVLGTLVKVFPADEVNHLLYPGLPDPLLFQTPHDQLPYYPHADATLLLNPYFHILESTARKCHEALVKIAGEESKSSKTNVVTAMISFVVSMKPDASLTQSAPACERKFITIPVDFDYKSPILSFDLEDAVFKDDNDVQTSIGSSLQRGHEMTGRDFILSADDAKSAKDKLLRMMQALDLPNIAKISAMISDAEIAEPVNLAYQVTSDVAKSTEHRHSERVLIRALKEPANLEKIVNSLRDHLSQFKLLENGIFTIHSGALLLYSYPNSICDPCSISLVSLQDFHDDSFLKLLIEEINKPADMPIGFRTRGYNSITQQQAEDEFGVTIIAGSKDVFAKDPYAQLVNHRPEAKYTCYDFSFFPKTPGINLRYKNGARGNNRLYEYTAGSQLHVSDEIDVAAPYSGRVFMSGAKKSKFGLKNTLKLENDIAAIVNPVPEPAI